MSKKTTIRILSFLVVLLIIALGITAALIVVANKNNVTISAQWQDWLVAMKLVKQSSKANVLFVRCR